MAKAGASSSARSTRPLVFETDKTIRVFVLQLIVRCWLYLVPALLQALPTEADRSRANKCFWHRLAVIMSTWITRLLTTKIRGQKEHLRLFPGKRFSIEADRFGENGVPNPQFARVTEDRSGRVLSLCYRKRVQSNTYVPDRGWRGQGSSEILVQGS